jgi:hypothetical protein
LLAIAIARHLEPEPELGPALACFQATMARPARAPSSSPDPTLIIETLIGPLWVRLLLTGQPITDDLADRVAELVARGATRA